MRRSVSCLRVHYRSIALITTLYLCLDLGPFLRIVLIKLFHAAVVDLLWRRVIQAICVLLLRPALFSREIDLSDRHHGFELDDTRDTLYAVVSIDTQLLDE